MTTHAQRAAAFTLIELLVVISVIGMLASIILVSLNGARAKAKVAATVAFESNMYHALGSSQVLRLDFEEGAGSVAHDSSYLGDHNDGTMIGGPTWITDTYNAATSKYGIYVGTGQSVALARGLGLSTSNFTIAQWVRTNMSALQRYTIGNAPATNGYRFGVSFATVAFMIGNGTGSTESTCGPGGLDDNIWHYIVGVFDRSAGTFICYVDGVQVGTTAISSYPGMNDAAPSLITLPCCRPFVGSMDDVAVYAVDLNGVAIRDLYETEKAKYVARK